MLLFVLPVSGVECPALELKDNMQTKQLVIAKPTLEYDTISSSISCLPDDFLEFARENNIGFPIICYSGCPRYSVIGYTFLQEGNNLKGALPCGHAGDQVSVTFTIFDTNYSSDTFNGTVRYTGTSDSIPLESCKGYTGLKVTSVGPDATQRSRLVEITAETSENARCRWSDINEKYSFMTRQFSTGEGTKLHSTKITVPEGESTRYISCMDVFGNQMIKAEPLKLKVSIQRFKGECSDTDGGKDPFVKGVCMDQETGDQQWMDSCTGKGDVVESFCGEEKCEFETITCERSNCVDGACLSDTDEDGVPDGDDLCPGTEKDAEIDTRGCAEEQLIEARIMYTTVERVSYRQGETAVFTIKIKNTGVEQIEHLWAGLDIYSPEGVRLYRTKTPNASDGAMQFDTDCRGGYLPPGGVRECKTEAQFSALSEGDYIVRSAIWNDVPGTPDTLLAGSKTAFIIMSSLLEPIIVTGNITDPSGEPVYDVQVMVMDPSGGHLADAFSNRTGDYKLSLPPYPVNLSYSKEGYTLVGIEINTPKTEVRDVELRLETSPPEISEPSPTGTTESTTVVMSVNTDKLALCSYSKEPDTPYYDMDLNMLSSDSGKTHSARLSDLAGGSHTYHIKCVTIRYDEKQNRYIKADHNEEDFTLSFSVGPGTQAQEEEQPEGDCRMQGGMICNRPSECSREYTPAADTKRCCKGFCYNAEANCLSDGRLIPKGETCPDGRTCECYAGTCSCKDTVEARKVEANTEVYVSLDSELLSAIKEGKIVTISPILAVPLQERHCLEESARLANMRYLERAGDYIYVEFEPVNITERSTTYSFKYVEQKDCEDKYTIYTKAKVTR